MTWVLRVPRPHTVSEMWSGVKEGVVSYSQRECPGQRANGSSRGQRRPTDIAHNERAHCGWVGAELSFIPHSLG